MSASPCLPRRSSRCPQLIQLLLIAKRIHGLPVAVVAIGVQMPLRCELFERLAFPCRRGIVGNVVEHLGRQHEEPSVDPAAIAYFLLAKRADATVLDVQEAEPRSGLNRC